MRERRITPEMIALIPALAEWGDCEIGIEDWVGHVGNFQLAIGYSRLFWPSIVKFGDYVLLEQFADEESVAPWAERLGDDKSGVEALLNHVHLADFHGYNPETAPNESQLLDLGRTLKAIYEAKLARSFPELRFMVEFDDTPGQDPVDYQVTFWTIR